MCVRVCVCGGGVPVRVEVCVYVCVFPSLLERMWLDTQSYENIATKESNIAIRIEQVRLFSFITLIFIFKVKLLAIYFNCECLVIGDRLGHQVG